MFKEAIISLSDQLNGFLFLGFSDVDCFLKFEALLKFFFIFYEHLDLHHNFCKTSLVKVSSFGQTHLHFGRFNQHFEEDSMVVSKGFVELNLFVRSFIRRHSLDRIETDHK